MFRILCLCLRVMTVVDGEDPDGIDIQAIAQLALVGVRLDC